MARRKLFAHERLPPAVVRGFVVPRYRVRKPFISVFIGQHGQFIISNASEEQRARSEAMIARKYDNTRPIYRLNLKGKLRG